LQKTGRQRRSLRLSTQKTNAHDHLLRQHLDNDEGSAFRTRGRKTTKLKPLQQLKPSTNQVLFSINVIFFHTLLNLYLNSHSEIIVQDVKHSSHYDIQKNSCDGESSNIN